MTFKDLDFKTSNTLKGVWARVDFDNGFGASIISNDVSYGGKSGLYEIAVLKGDNIISTTDVTNDVVGWLDDNDVTRTLNAISKLDKDGNLPKDVLL
jgi:hypothetical protein